MIVRRRHALMVLMVFELRIPAARGDCPYAPNIVKDNGVNGAAQAEGAYRVRESRSNYSSVVPGRPNRLSCVRLLIGHLRVENEKRPTMRSAQVGRLKRSRLKESNALRRKCSRYSHCTALTSWPRISTAARHVFSERDTNHFARGTGLDRRGPARATLGEARLSRAVELAKSECHHDQNVKPREMR